MQYTKCHVTLPVGLVIAAVLSKEDDGDNDGDDLNQSGVQLKVHVVDQVERDGVGCDISIIQITFQLLF